MKSPQFTPEQMAQIDGIVLHRMGEMFAQLAAALSAGHTLLPPPSGHAANHSAAPKSVATEDQLLDGKTLAAALGTGVWVIYAVKKANRIFHEQGTEPLIFSGRLSTPAKISAWLESHPEFIARRVLVPAGGRKTKKRLH